MGSVLKAIRPLGHFSSRFQMKIVSRNWGKKAQDSPRFLSREKKQEKTNTLIFIISTDN